MKPKRIWAMMGVVYMIILFGLTTYWIATTTFMSGITGILLFPLAGGLAAQFYNRSWLLRHGRFGGHEEDPDFSEPEERQPGAEKQLVLGGVFTLLALFLLVWGIWQILQFWGTRS